MAVWDDAYTDEPTHIRIFSDGVEWFVDGADDEGNCTEQCWSYDGHASASADVKNFIDNTALHSGVKWKWRQPRHDHDQT